MTTPSVSVFMPVYNGEKYLKEAIESVLSQTFSDFEFIIVNDGSNDDSQKIIDSYKDIRIRRILNPAPSGLIAVRNQGLSEASGKYFSPIDCDDIWHSKKLEKQLEFMDHHPHFALIGTRAAYIDEKGHRKGLAWRYNLPPERIPPFLLFGNYFIHSSVLMRRSMIPKEGYQTPVAEDYALWVMMSRSAFIWSLSDLLVKYRVHSGGVTYRQGVLANQMEMEVRKIFAFQLKQMGLEPTREEFELHCAINNKRIQSLDQLKHCADWLCKLISNNEIKRCYGRSALIDVILERWLICCLSALKLGAFRVVSVYFTLNISKLTLVLSPIFYFFPFVRYLRNKDLGNFGVNSL